MDMSVDEIMSCLDEIAGYAKYSKDLFLFLRGGNFLCASTPNVKETLWYKDLREKFPVYQKLYRVSVGEELMQKNGYYFFASTDSFNRDVKVQSLVDQLRAFTFGLNILRMVLQDVEPGNDRLRIGSVQRLLEGQQHSDLLSECRKMFSLKDKSMEETNFYTDEIFKMLEGQLGIVRKLERCDGTVYVIQESLNYYRDLLQRLPEVSSHDDESDFYQELEYEMPDIFKDEANESSNNKEEQ